MMLSKVAKNTFFLILCLLAPLGWSESDLADLSIEELMDLEVSSVTRGAQPWQRTAASITVLTEQDIASSGATNLPQLLRYVPGIHVARLDASTWSISARGFSGRFSNKLLVFLDGRMMYSPLFAGTEWEFMDIPLSDIKRIEIIRGPGGTLWGANAMNGVINIVLKSARETTGGRLEQSVGTELEWDTDLRYGDQLGDNTWYRVFASYTARDNGTIALPAEANDHWYTRQVGFRLEHAFDADTAFTLQGDVHLAKNTYSTLLASPGFPFTWVKKSQVLNTATNLLGRWEHTLNEKQDFSLQVYYEYLDQDTVVLDTVRNTLDIELQHHAFIGDANELVWGLGLRYTNENLNNTDYVAFFPENRRSRVFNLFFQNETELIDDRLFLTLGTKLEYHDFSGFEIQPTLRLSWTPTKNTTWWAAVSRSVRTPAVAEMGGRVSQLGLPFILVEFQANRNFDREEMFAFETGLRQKLTPKIHLNLNLYAHRYNHLRSFGFQFIQLDLFPWPPHITFPLTSNNKQKAINYGAELALEYIPTPRWRTQLGYSYYAIDANFNQDLLTKPFLEREGDFPRHMGFLLNRITVSETVELDVAIRYVGQLEKMKISDYWEADLQLTWQPKPDLTLILAGQNLLDNDHLEYHPNYDNSVATRVDRGVYAKVVWTF